MAPSWPMGRQALGKHSLCQVQSVTSNFTCRSAMRVEHASCNLAKRSGV